jgi:TRAP-type mannitol/chloroaromatic compound transport system permease large subunit
LLLIFAVLGSILAGVAPPTEAAAIGTGGAFLLAGLKLGASRQSKLLPLQWAGLAACILILILRNTMDMRAGLESAGGVHDAAMWVVAGACAVLFASLGAGLVELARAGEARPALQSTAHITAMVFVILIGASIFSLVFRGFGGDDLVHDLLLNVPGGKWGALFVTMLVMFILGFFLDFIEIVFVVVPLVAPPLILMGCDPVWLAILIAVNLQTSFLTPPFGFALFYLRGAAPANVTTLQIWQGAIPFIGLQIIILALVTAMPFLTTWLPALAAK